MTHIMTKTALIAAVTLLSVTPSYAASTQDEIQSCRIALENDGTIDMDDYRLRFEHKKGNRAPTLYLTAISYTGSDKIDVACELDEGNVVAFNIKDAQQFAAR